MNYILAKSYEEAHREARERKFQRHQFVALVNPQDFHGRHFRDGDNVFWISGPINIYDSIRKTQATEAMGIFL